MEIRHLRYFVAVADTGTFRAAAEREFVAQSSLSKQIARLEQELGTRLLERTTRSVRLTESGALLLEHARGILADVRRARDDLDALAGLRLGRLAVGTIQAGGALDQLGLVDRFHRAHPQIELAVTMGASRDLADAVRRGALDVSVVALPAEELPADLALRPVVEDPLVAVAPPSPQPHRATTSVARLVKGGPFIHYLTGSGLRHAVEAAMLRAGVSVEPAFELALLDDMVRLASLGLGVTIVPASAVAAGAPVTATPLSDPAAVHPIGIVTRATGASRAANAFVALALRDDAAYLIES